MRELIDILNLDTKTLEDFALCGPDKGLFLKKLVPNTEIHNFFSILTALKQDGDKISQKWIDWMQKDENNGFKLLYQFIKLENPDLSEQEFSDILKEINEKYLGFNPDNYTKPYITAADNLEDETNKEKLEDKHQITTEDENQLDLNKYLDYYFINRKEKKLTLDEKSFEDSVIYQVNLEKLFQEDHLVFQNFLTQYPTFAGLKGIVPLLVKLYEKRSTMNDDARSCFPLDYYTHLTLQQMEALGKVIPQLKSESYYIEALMHKKFSDMTKFDNEESAQIRYQKWLEIYNWSEQFELDVRELRAQLRAKILEVGIECQIYNNELFKTLLDNFPARTQTKSKLKVNETKEAFDIRFPTIPHDKFESLKFLKNKINLNKIIDEYVKVVIQHKEDIDNWCHQLDKEYMIRIYYFESLKKGKTFDNYPSCISDKEQTTLNQKKELSLMKHNKRYFSVDEDVKLYLKIKNISFLKINVYEINTYNYCKQEKKNFSDDIDLEGQVPNKTLDRKFEGVLPIISKKEEFVFDDLARRGIFIIEFLGNGLRTRAVVHKGSLNLLTKQVNNAVSLTIISEDKELCMAKGKTGIFFEGKEFLVDSKGKILMPFTAAGMSVNNKIVVFHEDFAQVCDLTINHENYRFSCVFLYNNENIRPGEMCNIIFQPKLYLNNKIATLKKIKEPTLQVIITNDNEVATSKNFDNLALSYNEDFPMKFQVPLKTKSIKFQFTGKIFKQEEGFEQISQSQLITIDKLSYPDVEGAQRYYSQYLNYKTSIKFNKKGYVLQFIGKNGDPIPGRQAKLYLVPNFYDDADCESKLSRYFSKTIISDEFGEVYLGQLELVKQLILHALVDHEDYTSEQISYKWTIDRNEFNTHVPLHYEVCEGDNIVLPSHNYSATSENFILYQETDSSQTIYELDLTCQDQSSLKIQADQLVCNIPKKGYYVLIYRKSPFTRIEIIVHEGQRWKHNESYLVKENLMIKLVDELQYQTIDKFVLNPKTLSFRICSWNNDTVKAHIFFQNFVNNKIDQKILAPARSQCPEFPNDYINFHLKGNLYCNEATLSDEIKYVYDRRLNESRIGNRLEKPSALAKRHWVGYAEEDSESLSGCEEYEEQIDMNKPHMLMFAANHDNKMPECRMKKKAKLGKGSNESYYDRLGELAGVISGFDIEQGDLFIGASGIVVENLKPDDNGIVSLDLDKLEFGLNNYGSLEIMISDCNSFIRERINVNSYLSQQESSSPRNTGENDSESNLYFL